MLLAVARCCRVIALCRLSRRTCFARVRYSFQKAEMLERWSNGTINANLHRVVTKASARPRFSMPFFYEPNIDWLVRPLDECVSDDRPALYEPIKFCDFLSHKFESTNEAVAVNTLPS